MKVKFSDVLVDVTKKATKIPKEEYLQTGLYQIIDQGQNEIAGYTNLESGLYSDVPAIIFGDHTRVLKYVDKPLFLGADGVKLIRPIDRNANTKYLFYALTSARIPNTGYNRHFKWLKQVEIPLPDAPTQERIVLILDKLSALISLRKQQLEKLDELVKARFVEMFGDPVENPMGWPVCRLDSLCENLDKQRIPITESDRKKGIYPYYGASGIVDYVDDYIFDDELLLVSEDGANLVLRSTPIAFSVSGKVWVNNHAHVLRFKNMAIQRYIEIYFSLIDVSGSITGTAQPKLNQAKLNAMLFCVPSESLLNKYNRFLQSISRSMRIIHASLNTLETLKSSLMQQYFG